MRTTKEDMEKASGKEKKKRFRDKGCSKSSDVTRWIVKNCKRIRVNAANSINDKRHFSVISSFIGVNLFQLSLEFHTWS